MKYYIGLDVSLKETFINVINDKGKTVYECSVLSEADAIGDCLRAGGYKEDAILGIESGQLSIHLCKALSKAGFEVKCVDARHMAAALSA
ncbi:transposase, partial [Rickettsiales endosymbiont of Peranema trichophorum]